MEILYFSSGMLTVAFLYAVVGVFKLKQRVSFLEIDKDQLHNLRNIAIDEVNRKIETTKQETDQNVWDLSRNISDQADEIYRHIDSRLDKLETRLTKNS